MIDPAAGLAHQWNNVPSAGLDERRLRGARARDRLAPPRRASSRSSSRRSRRTRASSAAPTSRSPRARPRSSSRFATSASSAGARKLADADGRAVLARSSVERLLRPRGRRRHRGSRGRDLGGAQGPGSRRSTSKKLGAEGIGDRRRDLATRTCSTSRTARPRAAQARPALPTPRPREDPRRARRRFGSDDVSTWREPRRLYPVGAQGAGATPELEFFDRGTWNQSIAMGE